MNGQAPTTRVGTRIPDDLISAAYRATGLPRDDVSPGRLARYALARVAGCTPDEARALALDDLPNHYPRRPKGGP
jgi:hypothetical protein